MHDHIPSPRAAGNETQPPALSLALNLAARVRVQSPCAPRLDPASPSVRVRWPAATSAAQRTLPRAAVVTQGAALWDVSGARDWNHTAGTRGPALHPLSAVQHRGPLRRAGMEPRAHSPTEVPLSYHENGSVITVYGFQWWFWVQVGWLALPRKSTRITIYKAWFGEMHASSVFQKTGARIQTLIETKMWPKLNVVLSLITT